MGPCQQPPWPMLYSNLAKSCIKKLMLILGIKFAPLNCEDFKFQRNDDAKQKDWAGSFKSQKMFQQMLKVTNCQRNV